GPSPGKPSGTNRRYGVTNRSHRHRGFSAVAGTLTIRPTRPSATHEDPPGKYGDRPVPLHRPVDDRGGGLHPAGTPARCGQQRLPVVALRLPALVDDPVVHLGRAGAAGVPP